MATDKPPQPQRRAALWKKLALAAGSTLACLAALEIGVRLLNPRPAEDVTRRWRFLQEFHPFLGIDRRPGSRKVLDDRYGRRAFTVNRLGFRGEEIAAKKPPGVFRIACLGGSTTENEFVDDSQTWCAVLQRLLRRRAGDDRIEVVNAGCATYTTAHSFINYALRVSDLKPDVVVIYHAINDLVPESCPGFTPDYRTFYRFYHLVGALQTDLHLEMETPLDPVLGWSALYRFVKREWARAVVGRFREPAAFHVRPADRLPPERSLVFERNLRAILRLVKADRARALLCTFPSVLRPDLSAADRARLGGYGWFKFLTVEGVYDGLQRHNAVIERLAREEGALLADLDAAAPKDFEHFFDACHMTPRGQRIVAETIARALWRAGLPPRRGAR